MVFQIQRLPFHITIALAVVVLGAVMPVSADLVNGHYNIAPTIHQSAVVFIGEEGLNITEALASANAQGSPTTITTIGWWASASDIHHSSPIVTVDVTGRQGMFTVTQAEFDNYEGQWYLVDSVNTGMAKENAGAVFNVKSPRLGLTIRNPYLNDGADISGTSVPNGTKLQFQIGTNMYTVLVNPLLRSPVYNTTGTGVNSDGYLDIRVMHQDGTILTKLYDDNAVERTLIGLNVTTQPFTWGRNNSGRGPGIDYVWNTSAYPPGTYIVRAQSKLNNMQSNYMMGSAAYTGRTVSEDKTITLVGGVPITNATTRIGVYKDGFWAIDYNGNYLWDGSVTDRFAGFGQPGSIPVVGDWNGDGITEIGVEKDGFWAIDYNGNRIWDGGVTDRFAAFGQVGDKPIVGDWNGDGRTEIGVEKDGFWAIDYNGNYLWDGPVTDRFAGFGQTGDIPVVGTWASATPQSGPLPTPLRTTQTTQPPTPVTTVATINPTTQGKVP